MAPPDASEQENPPQIPCVSAAGGSPRKEYFLPTKTAAGGFGVVAVGRGTGLR